MVVNAIIVSMIELFGIILRPFWLNLFNLSIISLVSFMKLYRSLNCFPVFIKLNIFLLGAVSSNLRQSKLISSMLPVFASINFLDIISIQLLADSFKPSIL